MTTQKPTHHDTKRIASQGGSADERMAAALAASAVEPRSAARGSLAAKRRRAADAAVRQVLFDIAATPAVRDGQRLTEDDLVALVGEHLGDASFPRGVTDALRPVALGVVKLAAAGERHQARDAARAAAVEVGESLARSSWSEADDTWDPEATISHVRRV